jgi:hypothetical protein
VDSRCFRRLSQARLACASAAALPIVPSVSTCQRRAMADAGATYSLFLAGALHDLQWVEADLLLHGRTPAWRCRRLAMDFSMAEAIDRAANRAQQPPTHVLELRLSTSELVAAFVLRQAVMRWNRPGDVELPTAVDLHHMPAPRNACIITAIPPRAAPAVPPPAAAASGTRLEDAAASATNDPEDAAPAAGTNGEEREDAEGRRTRRRVN